MNVGAALLYPPRFEEFDGVPVVLLQTPRLPEDVRTTTAVSLLTHKVLGTSDRYPRRIDFDGDSQLEQITVTASGTACFAGTNQLWQTEYLAVGAYTADMNGDGASDLVLLSRVEGVVETLFSGASGEDGPAFVRSTLGSLQVPSTV